MAMAMPEAMETKFNNIHLIHDVSHTKDRVLRTPCSLPKNPSFPTGERVRSN